MRASIHVCEHANDVQAQVCAWAVQCSKRIRDVQLQFTNSLTHICFLTRTRFYVQISPHSSLLQMIQRRLTLRNYY